ncbi:hypothetical protein UFOVP100_24 [uncultured Caudovirales phage]|uniref:Arc-type ribbon-helix-helix n=1 Tax=uncultured Caudovirales phage TaxID=2100421 RepID=A0A6J5L3M2_9CAUD|nr:hypothetical protein UFOVP100_24 [uncultured Caudovirales phage]
MAKEKSEITNFNMRIPRELLRFLKKMALEKEVTMTEMILDYIRKYKKRVETKNNDTQK